jgi:hypothetical protein
VLTGRVVLPVVHPRNLYHQRMRPTMGAADHAHDTDPTHVARRTFQYDESPPERLPLHRLVRVVAVPIRPPPGQEDGVREELDGEVFHKDLDIYEGRVEPNGSFSISVQPYKYGYVIAAVGDKVRLKRRMDQEVQGGQEVTGLNVDIRQTLLANVSLEMHASGRHMSMASIAEKVEPHIGTRIQDLENKCKGKLSVRDWRDTARQLVIDANLNPGALTFQAGDEVNYNVMSPAEFPDGGTSQVTFGSYNNTNITTQYASAGVRVNVSRPRGARNMGAREKNGYLAITAPDGGSADFYFYAADGGISPYKSVGMRVRNGTQANLAASAARRAFRFYAYDEDGAEVVQEYRWYTYQSADGGQFYGVTSPVAIGRVTITPQGPGTFMVDDITMSSSYLSAIADTLGWRSTGDWAQETSTANAAWTHLDRDRTANAPVDCAVPAADLECTYDENHSGNSYWQIPYGGTHDGDSEGSKLTSPAYTLSNLDVDVDDSWSFDYWLIGYRDFTETRSLTSDNCCPTGGAKCCEEPQVVYETPFDRITGGPSWNLAFADDGGVGTATMETHWSHVHWQCFTDPNADPAVTTDGGTAGTERYVEYSTDNGATWQKATWFDDTNHRGIQGIWWKCHMHPYPDSDLTHEALDAGCTNTDFNKDGVADYNDDTDGDGTGGYLDGDTDDCRQWDTEFYQEYVEPVGEYAVNDAGRTTFESNISGTSMLYRFRFNATGTPSGCSADAGCVGWAIDDVALNSDDEDVGYYSDFDEANDPNQ